MTGYLQVKGISSQSRNNEQKFEIHFNTFLTNLIKLIKYASIIFPETFFVTETLYFLSKKNFDDK